MEMNDNKDKGIDEKGGKPFGQKYVEVRQSIYNLLDGLTTQEIQQMFAGILDDIARYSYFKSPDLISS